MAIRRPAALAFTFPLVLAFGCGGAPSPTPTPTPGTTDATERATPAPENPATTADNTPEAADPAPPEPAPATKPSISCEPKAGTAAATGPKLALSIDRATVNLDAHKLEVKLNRAACKVELKVFGESGKLLADEAQAFNGAAPGTTLSVSWSPTGAEAVMRIEVWGHDIDGNFVGVAISPWSVAIAHEEVNFESDSDVIRPSEAPKLEASLGEINKLLAKLQDQKPSFFIKGHTDTVGTPEHNLDLSRRRARAIATWMRAHGLKIPIAYVGFGEHAPLVKTPDETPEPRNRRIDYFLSFEPPPLPSSPVSFSWKSL